MLEGDEILETAQETGYRLCQSEEGLDGMFERKKIFSASWDQCIPNRLFVCLTNGELEVHDLVKQKYSKYHLKFRRFLSVHEDSSSEEKIITSHWDRLVSVPGRPNEIIFLLGISRTLLFTSLPIQAEDTDGHVPLLSTFARKKPGFVHGSPVMELCSHIGRITSMATSSQGNILASGDERGSVRLILLQLLDTINLLRAGKSKPQSLASKLKPQRATYHPFLPTYNITKQLHDGPIFALNWVVSDLPARGPSGGQHVLATGSVDRAVRLWQVSCSTQHGLSIFPFMFLDTLSSHLLSLQSFCPDADRVYLACGTGAGTVHLWRFERSDLVSTMKTNSQLDDPPAEAVHGDAKQLVALLQPTDAAVIHISMTQDLHEALPVDVIPSTPTARATTYYTSPRVLLALSDTKGMVRVYGNSWHRPSALLRQEQLLAHSQDVQLPLDMEVPPLDLYDHTADEEMIRLRRKYQQDYDHIKVNGLLAEDDSLHVEGFVPVREELRDTPIVACQFSPPLAPHELLVAGHAGQLEVYGLENVVDTYSRHTSFITNLHKHHLLHDLASDANADTAGADGDRPTPLKNLFGLRVDKMATTWSDAHTLAPASPSSAPPWSAPPTPASPSIASAVKEPVLSPRPMPQQELSPVKVSSVHGLFQSGSPLSSALDDDDIDELPRAMPLNVQMNSPAKSTNAAERRPRSPVKKAEEAEKARNASPSPPPPPPAPTLASPHPISGREPSSGLSRERGSHRRSISPSPPPPPARYQEPTAASIASQAPGTSQAQTDGSSPSAVVLNEEDRKGLVPERKPTPYPPNNSMLHPALHSSKVTEIKLQQLDHVIQRLEEDDISLQTMETTSSDKRFAAKQIVHSGRRYDDLPVGQFLDEDDLERVTKDIKLSKNRPREIRNRDMGLTEEELAMLQLPEPDVKLQINFGARPGTNKYRYNDCYGLYAGIDGVRHLPEYRLEINAADVVGDISQRGYLTRVDAVQEEALDSLLFPSPFSSRNYEN